MGIPTAFGSPVWEEVQNHFPGPGFPWEPAEWRPNRYPAPDGQKYKGEPDWFLNGIPREALATEPEPDQCGVPLISPRGGAVVGGLAWAVPFRSEVCQCEAPASRVLFPVLRRSEVCQCENPVSVVDVGEYHFSHICECENPVSVVDVGEYHFSHICECESPVSLMRIATLRASNLCECEDPASNVTFPPPPPPPGPVISTPCCPVPMPQQLYVKGTASGSCCGTHTFSVPMIFDTTQITLIAAHWYTPFLQGICNANAAMDSVKIELFCTTDGRLYAQLTNINWPWCTGVAVSGPCANPVALHGVCTGTISLFGCQFSFDFTFSDTP